MADGERLPSVIRHPPSNMSERDRLAVHSRWRAWGPYLADRAWATVREDYSADADPWRYFPHDLARSKAYRWGEDGIAGFCDRYQILCRAALPSHAYQRMLYKYPQREYPYRQLLDENRRRGLRDPEFELIDTGVFDDGRYFDIEIEIAKEDEETLVFRVTGHNRGPDRAPLHLIPHLWFRNTWSWSSGDVTPPVIRVVDGDLFADDTAAPPLSGLLPDTRMGQSVLEVPAEAKLLFTNNETNNERLYGARSRTPYVKDAFHRCIVNNEREAANRSEEHTSELQS